MRLSKDDVIKLASLSLDAAAKKRQADLELALNGALDELSASLSAAGLLNSYDVALAANTRTTTLVGETNDLRYIHYIKINTTDHVRLLEYKELDYFLHTYDDPAAVADYANHYTITGATDGFPTIKLSCPLLVGETLTVYYFPDLSLNNISLVKSTSILANGTLAYFFGVGSQEGWGYYRTFTNSISKLIGAQRFRQPNPKELRLSAEDRAIRATVKSIARERE
jgi:hypothetical protein